MVRHLGPAAAAYILAHRPDLLTARPELRTQHPELFPASGPTILFQPQIDGDGLVPAEWGFIGAEVITVDDSALAPDWAITSTSGGIVSAPIPGAPPASGITSLRIRVAMSDHGDSASQFMQIEGVDEWDTLASLAYTDVDHTALVRIAAADWSERFDSAPFALDLRVPHVLELTYDTSGAQPTARIYVDGSLRGSVADTSGTTPEEHALPAYIFLNTSVPSVQGRWVSGITVADGYQGS